MSSSPKNILFRADSSSTIGTGHIMRDLVLAKQYPKDNIIFATQELSGNINHKISEAGYNIKTLKSNGIKELDKLIKKLDIDILVIDHYGIDYNFEKELKTKNSTLKILSFDDTYEKHHCDILLNHNISADEKKYEGIVPKECELRCGSKYTLLREEFYQKFPQKVKTKSTNILLAMGGADSRALNIKILDVLKSFENIRVDIITTTANQNIVKLKEYVSNIENITLHVNSSEVAKLMYKSDFAIVTPSVTVNEAYFMKLPFIAIKTEDNQEDIYAYLQKNNFSVLEKFDTSFLEKKIVLMLHKLDSQLINFTQLTSDEKEMILKWRNDDSVREWMYERDILILKNHLEYIESLNTKKNRVYFLVKNSADYLGVVDLTNIKLGISAELGIYSNPILKGQGTLLMSKIIDYAFNILKLKVLYANVYVENQKAIKLYERFNFKMVDMTKDKNGKLQNMELKNENR
ncbi:MAG: UDP-2,4-diacetamido-2,4,6-trideoxy-beta-L-altropyranose hydrolase [Campylobacterota bacterium]|nr:UDP-2,4-diacetamido-2,4,6-trideoxy-beta-L-altropyranose hydrolase [Campylobacterota bacterium]